MRYLAILVVAAITACGDSNGPAITPQLEVVAGAGQTDTVTQELPQLISVAVTDARSAAPLPSYPINWVALNGGSVFAPVTPSGSDGIARQRVWLGQGAGEQCFAARALDPETGEILVNVHACAIAMPDTAYSIYFYTSSVQVTVGDSIAVRWGYKDVYNNTSAHCRAGYPDGAVSWIPSSNVGVRSSNDTLWVTGMSAGPGGVGTDAHCIEGDPINGRNRAQLTVTVTQ